VRIGIQTWGSDGDIRPIVALANGLGRRSHQVTLVVTSIDGKKYDSVAAKENVRVIHTACPQLDENGVVALMQGLLRSRNAFSQLRIILGHFFDPLIDEMYDYSRELCYTNDLLIGHFVCHTLQAATELSGKPYTTVSLNHLGVPSRFKAPLEIPTPGNWANPFLWQLAQGVANLAFKKRANDLRSKVGLPATTNVLDDVFFSRSLNMLAVSSVFCPEMADWKNRHHVCGFFDIEEDDEKWQMPDDLRSFLSAGPPPVYTTLGSMLSVDPNPRMITETLVQAVLDAGTRAIVQSRWSDIADIPEHPHIFRIEKAPHHSVFPACSAVVHHGGAGTTHSATRCGCPSIVIQHFLDQQFWGKQLKDLGIGSSVLDRRTVTARKLSRAIRYVVEAPEKKARAERLGRLMCEERGVEKAVALIESHAIRATQPLD
jgi:sterol 3beta-glucosyltransferase